MLRTGSESAQTDSCLTDSRFTIGHTMIRFFFVAGVYEFMNKIGVPHVTCMNYDAGDHVAVEDCSKPDMGVCR